MADSKKKTNKVSKEKKDLKSKVDSLEELNDVTEVEKKDDNIKSNKLDKRAYAKNLFQSLILICGLACIIYGLYSMFFKEPKQEEQPEEKPRIQLKDVKKLYGYISKEEFHQNKLLTIQNIEEDIIFSELLNSRGFDRKTYESEGCEDYTQPCKTGEISYDDALSELKSKYGNISLTKDVYYWNYGLDRCDLVNDKFECYVLLGGLEDVLDVYFDMTNFIETDDKLLIYDKYVTYSGYYSDESKCYVDSNYEVECLDTQNLRDDVNSLTQDEILEKYGKEYVHTFLKDENGNYYWYSSEMVK